MRTKHILLIILVASAAVLGLLFWAPRREAVSRFYALVTDRERLKLFLTTFGMAAPVVFILLQVLQVIFAPSPGEVSGFIGGYLFGTLPGFLYSSIGLTAGSWINFSIGRFMGKRYIRKRIPPEKLERFDRLLKRRGLLVIFFLFAFPGFPKDYPCLFLGLSRIPLKVFLVMTALGRMPGTLILSLQGAALFEQMYGLLAGIIAVCLVLALVAYRYRDSLYAWAEQLNDR